MKGFLRKKSQSSSADGQVDALSGNNETVTNYRSFSEHTANSSTGNRSGRRSTTSSASPRTSSRQSRPLSRGAIPVNLVPSHEGLLEDQRNLGKNTYRGFSSSIHGLYTSTEYERVDCCAMTCGGIFQSDRDRYLLQGITPPSIARRFWLHIFFPFCIFALAAIGAISIRDRELNQFFSTSLVILLILYIILQCYKGRSKRIEIRKDLLWTKAQLQEDRNQSLAVLLEQQPPDDFDQEQEYYLGQTRRDFGCAHPCCILGFYAEDRSSDEMRGNRDENNRESGRDAESRYDSLSGCLWDFACPSMCGGLVQCCGVCALAQEGREIESAVLPAAYRRIDYMTMQPVSQYYPAIYKQRHDVDRSRSRQNREEPSDGTGVRQVDENERSGRRRKVILSDLSWQLINFALTVSALVFVWCLLGKHFWKIALNLTVPEWRIFDYTDFIVFIAVWAQAIGLTAVFSWMANRPCPTHLSLDAMVKFFAAGFCLSTSLAVFWEVVLGLFTKVFVNIAMAIFGVNVVVDEDGYSAGWIGFGAADFARNILGKTGGDDFIRAFGNDHPIFYTVYIAIASFILAAFVEESCKYFGYRMIEHPDFMSQREIEEAMTVVIQQGADDDDSEMEMRREQMRRVQQRDLDQTDFSKQKKSVQSLGAAITLAMVTVAMGFTCCENMIYTFVYSGSTISMEISVLLARSFFPIHPIAAALQSIHVVEREVEVTRTAKLGRILLPAVAFHGLYDFAILWIDFMSNRNGGNYVKTFDVAGLASFIFSAGVMVCGIVYYFVAAGRQRARLQVTDQSIESGISVLT